MVVAAECAEAITISPLSYRTERVVFIVTPEWPVYWPAVVVHILICRSPAVSGLPSFFLLALSLVRLLPLFSKCPT